jgi:hypothetical protein
LVIWRISFISTELIDQNVSPARHPKNDHKKNVKSFPLVQDRPVKMTVIKGHFARRSIREIDPPISRLGLDSFEHYLPFDIRTDSVVWAVRKSLCCLAQLPFDASRAALRRSPPAGFAVKSTQVTGK